MRKRSNILCSAGLIGIVALSACGARTRPTFEYMANMMDSPAVKAQKEPPSPPLADTLPRGDFVPYPYALDQGPLAGEMLSNPLPRTRKIFERGQHQFTTYCAVCHGKSGLGDGPVVPKFPHPPSLLSEKIRDWKDGQIYHTITMGQNVMPSYASQVDPVDRWAIVHYVRALERAAHPTTDDIEKLKAKMEEMKP